MLAMNKGWEGAGHSRTEDKENTIWPLREGL